MRRSLLLLLLLSSCATQTTEKSTYAPPAPIPTTLPSVAIPQSAENSATVPVVQEILSPYGPPTPVAFTEMQQVDTKFPRPRWSDPQVSVGYLTIPTQEDVTALESLNDSLRTLAGVPTFITATSAADVDLYFLPKSRWAEISMATSEMGSVNGYTKTTHRDGKLMAAVVVIDSTLDQPSRNKTLVHELLHALGLGHHNCAGGMMFGGSPYDPSWFLSPYDLTMLEAWYNENHVRTLKALPCPAIKWDVVGAATGTGNMVLWCQKPQLDPRPTDPQICFEVSPVAGPIQILEKAWFRDASGAVSQHDPVLFTRVQLGQQGYLCEKPTTSKRYAPCEKNATRIVARNDAWFDGNSLTIYDPELYVAFSFEDRRLLCEKPTLLVPYTPCQFTEGSVVSVIDRYTDGTMVYREIPPPTSQVQ